MEAMGDAPNPEPSEDPQSPEAIGMDGARVADVKAALADVARLFEYAADLADAVEVALPDFVARSVWSRLPEDPPVDRSAVADAVAEAGRRARDELGERVRVLLAQDIDEQRTNPLAILRTAVRYPTELLRGWGIPPVPRDPDAVRLFPDDDYDLTPGSFADIDPALHEPGLLWGAAKAHVHLARRRKGQRPG
jgi:hypothetical protein